MTEVRASVVIPVRNGADCLATLLPRLRAQAVAGGLEILAIDSGSSDASRELLERHAVRTLSIAADAFDHGETRNLGARESRGACVVFLTQDALPADDHFVERLVAALEGEARLAGVFARQEPRADAHPLTRRDLAGWVAAGREPRTVFVSDPSQFELLPPLEKYTLSAFDNVASAVRRSILLAHPFAATRFGEDVEWGRRMLLAGYGLGYVPQAVVLHSHARSARALFRRNYLGHRLLSRLFGLRAVPDVPHLLRASLGASGRDLADLLRAGAGPLALLAAPAQSVAAVYGQYRGARDEAGGRPYPEWAA